jgi:hypothetical protein
MTDRRKDLGLRLLDKEFGFLFWVNSTEIEERDLEGFEEADWLAYANGSSRRRSDRNLVVPRLSARAGWW